MIGMKLTVAITSCLADHRKLFDELNEAGVIDSRRGEYRFRYKYIFYFFVARYLRDNINKTEILECISKLSRQLHHEESANIMIFLCHLSKDERVLGAMLVRLGACSISVAASISASKQNS